MRTHRPPTTCPVCSESLITLRLGCPSCGTELSGHFESCRFCRLGAADLEILEVFLKTEFEGGRHKKRLDLIDG